MISSCGSTQGVVEFQQYTKAFELQLEAGNHVLDSVARAERIIAKRRIQRRGSIPDFRPEEAAYWIDSAPPPVTESIRSSLKILKSYNDALGGLANGESAKALAARQGKLLTDIAGTGVFIASIPSGAAAIPNSAALLSTINANIASLTKIFEVIYTRTGRENFRKQLIDAAPIMNSFVVELRKSTPIMFSVMEQSRYGETDTSLSGAKLAELERERKLLAGWVLLMDKTLFAMDMAVEAASTAQSSVISTAAVSEAAIELKVVAEQVKNLRSAI